MKIMTSCAQNVLICKQKTRAYSFFSKPNTCKTSSNYWNTLSGHPDK